MSNTAAFERFLIPNTLPCEAEQVS